MSPKKRKSSGRDNSSPRASTNWRLTSNINVDTKGKKPTKGAKRSGSTILDNDDEDSEMLQGILKQKDGSTKKTSLKNMSKN